MNFKDLDDKELNPAFLSFGSNIEVKYEKNYLDRPNTRGVLEVKSIIYKNGFKGESVIVELEVVECEGTNAYKPGEKVTWMKKIGKTEKSVETKRRDLLTGLARIAGMSSCPPDQVQAFLTKCTSSEQPLTGFRVAYAVDDKWANFKSMPSENTPEKVSARRGGE
jgi:hypothetical protein